MTHDKKLLELQQRFVAVVLEFKDLVVSIAAHRKAFGVSPEGSLKRLLDVKREMARLQVAMLRTRADMIEEQARRDEFKNMEVPDFLPEEL